MKVASANLAAIRARLYLCAGLASVLALSGCGGGGGSNSPPSPAPPPPAATVSTGNDARTLDWRSSADIDVLANDSTSQGSLQLVSVGTPANGTASIVGGVLRYTPADGFVGTDSVTYVAGTTAGSATATATVQLTVQARLTLSGTVTDAPVPGAQVTVRVDGESFQAVADNEGRYSVSVTSLNPAAWVEVSAIGGAGNRTHLVAALGEVATLGGRLPETGTNLAGQDVTHWTTARHALALRAAGEDPPRDDASYARAASDIRVEELLRLATVVRLVADHGQPLPQGATDTWALVQDDDAVGELVEAVRAQGNAYDTVLREVRNEAPPAHDFALPVTTPRDLVFSTVNPIVRSNAIVTLRPDGTARVNMMGAVGEATWALQGAKLRIDYTGAPPYSVINLPDRSNNNQQVPVHVNTLGYVIQYLDAGTARLGERISYTYGTGTPNAGQPFPGRAPVDGEEGNLYGVYDMAERQSLGNEDLAVGTRLAGLFSEKPTYSGSQDSPVRQDVLRITGAGTGLFEVSNKAATWTIADGWLSVSTAGAPTVRYTRVTRDVTVGTELWVGRFDSDGAPDTWVEVIAVTAQNGLAFTIDNATRRWRGEGFYAVMPNSASYATLLTGGTASGTLNIGSWRVENGHIKTERVLDLGNGPVTMVRDWIPLRQVGPHWLVLEMVDFTAFGSGGFDWRINWYRDLGPSAD